MNASRMILGVVLFLAVPLVAKADKTNSIDARNKSEERVGFQESLQGILKRLEAIERRLTKLEKRFAEEDALEEKRRAVHEKQEQSEFDRDFQLELSQRKKNKPEASPEQPQPVKATRIGAAPAANSRLK